MSRIVFGRDRLPEPWPNDPKPRECAAGSHLIDRGIERCTICGWLDPAIERCSAQGCDFPADYEVEVADKGDLAFANVLRSALFCNHHAFLGGIALAPDGPVA